MVCHTVQAAATSTPTTIGSVRSAGVLWRADASPTQAPPRPAHRRHRRLPAGISGARPEHRLWEGTPHGLLNPIETHAIRWELTTERLQMIRGILNRSTEESS